MRILASLEELASLVGQEVAVSEWTTITQEQIDLFARATGDHQWIHVDPERAARGPFGAPVAHGFLTLSLLAMFMESALAVRDSRMGLNYGLNRVRFMAPVRAGTRVRARLTLLSCDSLDDNAVQTTWTMTVEMEGEHKPACVAEWITRRYR